MKSTALCSLVAAISMLFGMSSCGKTECGKTVTGDPAASSYENIMTRTSIRQYTDREVSAGAVDSLLRAAMAAPTAGNKQPWKFLVLDDRAVLDSVAAMAPAWAPVGRAPLAIIVCGDKELGFPGEANDFWIQTARQPLKTCCSRLIRWASARCGAVPIPRWNGLPALTVSSISRRRLCRSTSWQSVIPPRLPSRNRN